MSFFSEQLALALDNFETATSPTDVIKCVCHMQHIGDSDIGSCDQLVDTWLLYPYGEFGKGDPLSTRESRDPD